MTVQELIELLQKCPNDLEVVVATSRSEGEVASVEALLSPEALFDTSFEGNWFPAAPEEEFVADLRGRLILYGQF